MDGDMFTDRTIMVALFTIAIASSLIGVSGFVSSAFADTEKATNQDPLSSYLSFPIHVGGQKPNSPIPNTTSPDHSDSTTTMSNTTSPDHSDSTTTNNNSVHKKDLKNLSNCESSAAADGDLTAAEVTDCYQQVI
jgi:hypothetical protein